MSFFSSHQSAKRCECYQNTRALLDTRNPLSTFIGLYFCASIEFINYAKHILCTRRKKNRCFRAATAAAAAATEKELFLCMLRTRYDILILNEVFPRKPIILLCKKKGREKKGNSANEHTRIVNSCSCFIVGRKGEFAIPSWNINP